LVVGRGAGDFDFVRVQVRGAGATALSFFSAGAGDKNSAHRFGGGAENTIGSSFDTSLAAYTGAAVNALTEVASNDDYLSTIQSVHAVGGIVMINHPELAIHAFPDATLLITPPECPVSTSGSLPFAARSHTRVVPSQEFVITRLPSEVTQMSVTLV